MRRKAQVEMDRRVAQERGRYYTPNGALEQVLKLVDRKIHPADTRTHIVIVRAANGIGKTAFGANLASYLSGRYPNEYLDECRTLKNYRRPNRGRILTTANAAKTAYDEELAKWLPRGSYLAGKNGHNFLQYYKVKSTGSEFDILTFDQDPMQGESVTLDWAIVDEPMPRRHFSALKSRFRFGGIIFMLFTALEGSGWYKHELEDSDRLGEDVHLMEIDAEANCITHGVRGILPHAALESMWADFDEAELPARKDGKYLASSGIIYPHYRDERWVNDEGAIVGHVIEQLTGYHLDCYNAGYFTMYCVSDPHDRKPYAFAWKLVFPNMDRITVAEWPDESMRLFHKIRNCDWKPWQYAQMIKSTELAIAQRAADYRIMDPNFGNAIKSTSKSTVAGELEAAGREIDWPLRFNTTVLDDIQQGHIAVRQALGNPRNGIRPKNFTMAHCKNTRFGLRNYAYKENRDETKGLSVAPEYQYKDFPDLDRYFEISGPRYNVPSDDPAVVAAQVARRERGMPKKFGGYVSVPG